MQGRCSGEHLNFSVSENTGLMLETFTFEESAQTRLEELQIILCSDGKIQAQKIQKQWSAYMETVVEPAGWKAIWKPSRITCEQRKIEFPCLFVAEIWNVNCTDLTAGLNLLECPAGVIIISEQIVPLLELFPTQQQENDAVNVRVTAKCLDQLRFFYNHIWQPWDDENDAEDWPTAYLQARVQLHFDMLTGVIPHETTQRFKSLLQEGRENKEKLEELEQELGLVDLDVEVSENDMLGLMQIHLRQDELKNEVELLENPAFRNVLVKQKRSKKKPKCHENPELLVVWGGAPLEELKAFLHRVERIHTDNKSVRCYPCLQDALDAAVAGDTIVLPPGVHRVRGTGGLEESGVLQGVGDPAEIILEPDDAGDILLNFSGEVFHLQDLTVKVESYQTTILLQRGVLTLQNCHLHGGQHGVLVLEGGDLKSQNSHIVSADIGVEVRGDATVELTHMEISQCRVGIQLEEESTVHLQESEVTGSQEYGICVQTTEPLPDNTDLESGSLELLNRLEISSINLEGSTLQNNTLGDAAVMYKDSAERSQDSSDSGCIFVEGQRMGELTTPPQPLLEVCPYTAEPESVPSAPVIEASSP